MPPPPIVAIERDLGLIEQRYGEITLPAGILFGARDRVLGIDIHGRPMADKIGGLDFERVDGLGHMPQFIDPERVTAFIKRMAARLCRQQPFRRRLSDFTRHSQKGVEVSAL